MATRFEDEQLVLESLDGCGLFKLIDAEVALNALLRYHEESELKVADPWWAKTGGKFKYRSIYKMQSILLDLVNAGRMKPCPWKSGTYSWDGLVGVRE